jgi:hypothetical protein
VHVPGLAFSVPELTVAHAEMLLGVPMKRLRACPSFPVDSKDACDIPEDAIGNEEFPGLTVTPTRPEDHETNLVVNTGELHGLREVPLFLTLNDDLLAVLDRYFLGQERRS